jgi:hypothetical protein
MEHVAAEVRCLLLIRGFAQTALYPAPLNALHIANYFADALAPVWGGGALEKRVLKRAGIPRNRKIQAALDRLVGRGMLIPHDVSYEQTPYGSELRCFYATNASLTGRFSALVESDQYWADEAIFIAEVAMAVSTFGSRIDEGVQFDASYSDPLLDVDTVVDLETSQEHGSLTAVVNERIAALAAARYGRSLEPAELTNLYLRHLLTLSFSGGESRE